MRRRSAKSLIDDSVVRQHALALGLEHLAVVVVVVAVGLQAQQVPAPDAQLGAIDRLGEKVLGAGAQPAHPGVAIVQRA